MLKRNFDQKLSFLPILQMILKYKLRHKYPLIIINIPQSYQPGSKSLQNLNKKDKQQSNFYQFLQMP